MPKLMRVLSLILVFATAASGIAFADHGGSHGTNCLSTDGMGPLRHINIRLAIQIRRTMETERSPAFSIAARLFSTRGSLQVICTSRLLHRPRTITVP